MSKRKLSDVSNYTPKPHQPEAILKLLKNRYHILADDMGLGKTFEFLAHCLILNKRAVICCPAYLKGVWEKEISKVCKFEEDRDLFSITSYSKSKDLLQILRSHNADIIGFDEGHYLKNMEAKRTINTFKALQEFGVDRIVLMSGTPIKNRVGEWYSILRLIHWHIGTDFVEIFPNKWSFETYFCYERSFQVKGKNGRRRQITTFSGLRENRRKELLKWVRPIMTRRMANKVLDMEKPEFIYVNADISKQYDEDLIEAFESGKDSSAKRKSALAKVPFVANFAKDILETGEKLVIFTCHPEAALKLKEKLKIGEVIIGDILVEKRQPIVDRFQDGDTQVLFCSIGAASTGYTMTAASKMIFNDMSYVVGDNDQAYRRIARMGQKNKVFIYCIGGSEKDSAINKALRDKERDLKRGI